MLSRSLLSISLAALAACGSAAPPEQPQPDAPVTPPVPDAPPATVPDAPTSPAYGRCGAPVPAGAPTPVMPSLPAAGCPVLAPGVNTLTSSDRTRELILVLPTNLQPTERPPVLFLWHWLGSNAHEFLTRAAIQAAADQQRFIAVLPQARGARVLASSLDVAWPFDISQAQGRIDEEIRFFDDMLACVAAQYAIDTQCISSVGVSAGALFTAQLAQARSETLASFVSLSGGTGATIIRGWNGSTHKLPALVLWGGDGPPAMDGHKDLLGCQGLGMDFSVASRDLETALDEEGHFLVECRHNCGHVEPPLPAPAGMTMYAAMWEFALAHPFWLPAGASPFQTTGLPSSLPAWCAIGRNNSAPRTGGSCPEGGSPCPN